MNQGGPRNVRSVAGRRFSAPGATYDNVLPWAPSSLGRRQTTEDDGRCVASWRCDGTKDGAAALWTFSWNGRVKTRMGTSGKNPGSALPFSRKICVKRRGGSKRSCLARGSRRQRQLRVGALRDGRPLDRDRREKGTCNNGGHGYARSGESARSRVPKPAALEPQTSAD